MIFRKLFTLLLTLATLAVVAGCPVTAQTFYVADDARQLFTYDVSEDKFTPVGSPMSALIYGMGCADPTPTLLYGTDPAGVVGIYSIDPTTGTADLLGRVPGHNAIGSTVGPDGNVWAIGMFATGRLYKVDPASLAVTDIGNTGFVNYGQPCFDASGNLYTFRNGTVLYQLDPDTAEATAIGNIGFPVAAAAFCKGTLYGFTGNRRVITIDTTTGAGTVIATYGAPVTGSIEAVACCSPD
jgi:streptogramin lyase